MRKEPPLKPPREPREGELTYRLFFFDGAGHISKSHEFLASDDKAALKVAEGWREGRKMELWQRDRRVKRWE